MPSSWCAIKFSFLCLFRNSKAESPWFCCWTMTRMSTLARAWSPSARVCWSSSPVAAPPSTATSQQSALSRTHTMWWLPSQRASDNNFVLFFYEGVTNTLLTNVSVNWKDSVWFVWSADVARCSQADSSDGRCNEWGHARQYDLPYESVV